MNVSARDSKIQERGCVVPDQPQHIRNSEALSAFHALRLVFDTAALHFQNTLSAP